jgi:hypothetical protein
MADTVMADTVIEEREREEIFSRPFHEAYLTNKVVCPMAECLENFRFFKESGLAHHFSTVHNRQMVPQDTTNSAVAMKHMFGEETLRFIKYISERKSEVSFFVIFCKYKASNNVLYFLCANIFKFMRVI